MEFTVPRDVLSAALVKIRGAVSQKDVRPTLKCVRILAAEDKLMLESTNLELSQRCFIHIAQIKGGGETLLPALKLCEIVDAAGGKEVTFRQQEQLVSLNSGRASWKVLNLPPDDFPVLPSLAQETFTVPREHLLNGLNRVSFAISDDETRENLMMVCVDAGQMAATGGHRAASVDFQELGQRLQIPEGALSQLVRLLSTSGAKDITIGQDEAHLSFDIAGDLFSTRQTDSEFPDIQTKLFAPTAHFSRELRVERELLRYAVRRMRILSDPGSNAIVLEGDRDKLTVISFDGSGNESQEEVSCNCPHPVSFGVNADYVDDLLKVLSGKEVLFKFNDSIGKSPARIEEPGFISVLLPLRVNRPGQA